MNPQKAILYARFSPRPNAEGCTSIKTQITLFHEYCQEQGYEPFKIFTTPDTKGAEEKRPDLWAAMNALKPGYILIIENADRLARNVYLAELLYREASEKGARIEAIHGGTNGESNEQILLRQIMQAVAEWEAKAKAARTKIHMRAQQANGRRVSFRTPYGYRADPDRPIKNFDEAGNHIPAGLVEDPEEQAVMARIAALHKSGTSLRGICSLLETEGIRPRGAHWHHSAIKSILKRMASQ